MKRIIRLTESDLTRIVRRVLKEEECLGLEPPKWLQDFTFGQAKMDVICDYLTWHSDGYNDNSDETPGFKVLVDLRKMELEVTIMSMDDILEDLEDILGEPKESPTFGLPLFKYEFSDEENNGDLYQTLYGIRKILLSSNNLKESYRRRY